MLSKTDLLIFFIAVIAFIGAVFLIIYYKASDEDKQNGYLIAGWILVSPLALAAAYGIVGVILLSFGANVKGF